MGKQQQDKKPAAAPDKLFVFGMDDKGRPRGARFAQHNDRVVNAALDLSLNAVKVASPAFAEAVLGAIARRRRVAAGRGVLIGSTTRAFLRLRGPETVRLEAALSVAEQSNNSVVFGERLILKVFRRLEEGVNPELEVGRFLTEKTNFAQIAPLAGSLEEH